MAKDRSYGDRGTGYTPRNESVPGTKNEKKYGRGARWCKRCGCYAVSYTHLTLPTICSV